MGKIGLFISCATAISILISCVVMLPPAFGVESNNDLLTSETLEVYSDSACTQALSSVNWGIVHPGGSVCKTIYVKNAGSYRQKLSLSTANWNPATANGPLVVSWNREGAEIAAGQVATANLSLAVASTASGLVSFSVDLVITSVSVTRFVEIWTNKAANVVGETMTVYLRVVNPDSVTPVRAIVKLGMPSGATYGPFLDMSVTLPAGFNTGASVWSSFVIPVAPIGTYSWIFELRNPTTNTLITTDTWTWTLT